MATSDTRPRSEAPLHRRTWLALLLALPLAAAAQDDTAPKKKKGGFLANMRYAIGVAGSAGGGIHRTVEEGHGLAEPFALEFRSYFTDKVAWHTTLNLWRMIWPAATRGQGRLDYDLHVGGHLPIAERTDVVIAPGASIAYAFNGDYERFVGDVRLGLDIHEHDARMTWGLYVRPFVGWLHDDPVYPAVGRIGVTAGALAEVIVLYHIPKKGERGQPTH